MNCKKLQLDQTATSCNWTCSCSSKDSGTVRFWFSGNLMPGRTATGLVGVSLNWSLVGTHHELLHITSCYASRVVTRHECEPACSSTLLNHDDGGDGRLFSH